ncbi:hypothetical protein IGI04_015407, partial [Brassica rapa subsp. trilocularis]
FFRSELDFGRLPNKSSNAFYARRFFTKSSGSLLKSSAKSDLSQTLEDFTDDSWKTLRRLSEDFLGSLQIRFMLEDFVGTLQETLEEFSDDFYRRLLGKSSI